MRPANRKLFCGVWSACLPPAYRLIRYAPSKPSTVLPRLIGITAATGPTVALHDDGAYEDGGPDAISLHEKRGERDAAGGQIRLVAGCTYPS